MELGGLQATQAPETPLAAAGGAKGAVWSRGSRAVVAVAGLTAVAVGLALRLYRLDEQILTGDELHALHGALRRPLGLILTRWTYYGADYSVPLAAFYRMLMDAGMVLDEMTLRAPALVASALTLVVIPLALRRRLGTFPALALVWLLALSPMLVLYGRMVRSYAPMVLLATGAILAFDRFLTRGSRRAAATYVACAAAATYLHLGAAPFVLAPFLFAAALLLREPSWRPALARLAAVAAALAAAFALFLVPALPSLLRLTRIHGEGRPPPSETWLDVLRLQAGSTSWLVVALILLALVRGAPLRARRDPRFAGLLAVVVTGHVAGLLLLAPNFLEAAIVTNRYMLVAQPLGLAVLALGLATPLARGRPAAALQACAVALLLAALLATGPFVREDFRFSSYTHGQPFVYFLYPGDRIASEAVPRFYHDLPAGDEPLVEAPWTNVGTHAFSAYQRFHRRPLRVASPHRIHTDPRIQLRNTLRIEPEAFVRSGARFVVVHRNLHQEEMRVTTLEHRHHELLERAPELWALLRQAGAALEARLREEWGPPDYEDPLLVAWEVPPPGEAEAGPSRSAVDRER
jgi:hypothetical protein